jgi:thymidylate synthase ThyX
MQVQLIKHSIANGIAIATFILEYPRIIHSELMTHRVFSRNSASSRAIPTKAVIQDIRNNPADIVWWGKNMTGMQAKEELSGWRLKAAKILHVLGRESAILISRLQLAVGLHKQIANRRLETYQNIRVVVTSTEWNNFFALRNHPDAQPEFQLLASMMYSVMTSSNPQPLKPGEWHIPYLEIHSQPNGDTVYGVWQDDDQGINLRFKEFSLEAALKISASMAAQESYRKSDPSLAKAEAIWERLVGSMPVHASPTEHQAMAMINVHNVYNDPSDTWEKGVTHMDRGHILWSGNLRGWIQHRQLIPNHHVPG